jgi:hypothetical protein
VIPRDDSEQLKGADERPVSGNLIPPMLGLIGIGLIALGVWAFGLPDNQSGALPQCAAITDDRGRLDCYDQLAAPHQPAKGAIAPLHTRPREDSPREDSK